MWTLHAALNWSTDNGSTFDFATRANANDITEQFMSSDIPLPEPPSEPPTAPRMKLKANTDMSKFSYRTMTMKLSEASEVLDDRIEEFRQLLQESMDLDDSAFGNPSLESPNQIIAVGRIASDSSEGKLNTASLVLEGSRRGARTSCATQGRQPLLVQLLPRTDCRPARHKRLRRQLRRV